MKPMLLPLLLALYAPQDPAAAILGRWEGTSICIKADWNAACHDEVVRYVFTPDTAVAGGIMLTAFKQVAGVWDPMYDLALHYEPARHRWAGEFSNSRVHIEWSYWLQGADLAGKVIMLPDGRKGRDVIVHRPPPASR